MANAIYDKYKAALLTDASNIDIVNGAQDVKAILIDVADYTFSQTHEFLSDVPVAARVAISAGLTGKTGTDGVFDADDVTWPAVTGDPCEAIILFLDTTVAGTSRLVAYLDTSITGLPVTPSGGDITAAWNASGIFKL